LHCPKCAENPFPPKAAASSKISTAVANLQAADQAGFNELTSTMNTGFTSLSQGLAALVQQGNFVVATLARQSQQNDTIICILEHISKNTCSLLNEAAVQTRLQTSMARDVHATSEMYRTVNPAAALALARQEALEHEMAECCPPATPPSPCSYEPCPLPVLQQPPLTTIAYPPVTVKGTT
jgi:hypothetical protein